MHYNGVRNQTWNHTNPFPEPSAEEFQWGEEGIAKRVDYLRAETIRSSPLEDVLLIESLKGIVFILDISWWSVGRICSCPRALRLIDLDIFSVFDLKLLKLNDCMTRSIANGS